MFIERIANTIFSSVGAASVARGCRSYGARGLISPNIYKHCAPTERGKLCRDGFSPPANSQHVFETENGIVLYVHNCSAGCNSLGAVSTPRFRFNLRAIRSNAK